MICLKFLPAGRQVVIEIPAYWQARCDFLQTLITPNSLKEDVIPDSEEIFEISGKR